MNQTRFHWENAWKLQFNFLTKYISQGAVDLKFPPDCSNNPSSPHMQRNETTDVIMRKWHGKKNYLLKCNNKPLLRSQLQDTFCMKTSAAPLEIHWQVTCSIIFGLTELIFSSISSQLSLKRDGGCLSRMLASVLNGCPQSPSELKSPKLSSTKESSMDERERASEPSPSYA